MPRRFFQKITLKLFGILKPTGHLEKNSRGETVASGEGGTLDDFSNMLLMSSEIRQTHQLRLVVEIPL